jgi:hypothetical protein
MTGAATEVETTAAMAAANKRPEILDVIDTPCGLPAASQRILLCRD